MKIITSFFSCFFVLFSNLCHAQDGSLDTSFNSFGEGFSSNLGANNTIWASAIQTDGKTIIGGEFTFYNGIPTKRIARLNTDGTLDKSFETGAGFNNSVFSIAIQSNGKIIVGGDFTSYNNVDLNRLVRLNVGGELDQSFNTGTGANGSIKTIAIKENGRVVIGGIFTAFNGETRNRIAQIKNNGILDELFDSELNVNGTVESIAITENGKIILGGNFTTVNGVQKNRLARLDINGDLDPNFNFGNGANDAVLFVKILANNKILVGGRFDQFNNLQTNCLVRLNSIGAIDPTFQSPLGSSNSNKVVFIALQGDKNILIGGKFSIGNGDYKYLLRIKLTGLKDESFNSPITNGFDPPIIVNTISVQMDGKIVVGGNFNTYFSKARKNLARLNTNGELEYAGANNYIYNIAKQGNKTIIGGFFTAYNGEKIRYLARLKNDGKLDTTFDANTNFSVQAMAVQPDGKILISGGFSNNGIYRINRNGSIDLSFNPGLGPNNTVDKISLQPDGKIVIAGFFSTYNGTSRNCIARLNANGSLDPSFSIGTGFFSNSIFGQTVLDIFIYPSGKILAVGEFTEYNGEARNRVIRLNINGSIDQSFDPGSGADFTVGKIAVQPNRDILIGGAFSHYNGIASNRMARLHPDGSLDESFQIGTGPNRPISEILILDEKIYVGGAFTVFNGENHGGLIRLNPYGNIDESFQCGTGVTGGDNPFGNVKIILPNNNGSLLIGGDFTNYNGTEMLRIAKIFVSTSGSQNTTSISNYDSENSLDLDHEILEKSNLFLKDKENHLISIFPNPCSNTVTIKTKEPVQIKLLDLRGKLVIEENVSSSKTIDVKHLKNGIYFIKSSNGLAFKLIKE